MNHFSINDIENLTGVKAHTLRIWEQRYGVCQAKRKESGHRYYDAEDLKSMLRLIFLYRSGHRMSQLAGLEEDELRALALSKTASCSYDTNISQLTEATQSFDQQRFDKLLHMMILHLGFEKCILDVVYPFLERLGLLWLTDRALIAHEHFASNLIQKKIIVAIDGLERPRNSERVVLLYTPGGEAHEIPLLFMQYLFKKYGTRTIYMGRETEQECLVELCTKQKVTHLYFHLITHLGDCDVPGYIRNLGAELPGVAIVASGRCLENKTAELPGEVQLLKDYQQMISFARGQ